VLDLAGGLAGPCVCSRLGRAPPPRPTNAPHRDIPAERDWCCAAAPGQRLERVVRVSAAALNRSRSNSSA
jgi:hypothetical protein